jgi:hypothetical protein
MEGLYAWVGANFVSGALQVSRPRTACPSLCWPTARMEAHARVARTECDSRGRTPLPRARRTRSGAAAALCYAHCAPPQPHRLLSFSVAGGGLARAPQPQGGDRPLAALHGPAGDGRRIHAGGASGVQCSVVLAGRLLQKPTWAPRDWEFSASGMVHRAELMSAQGLAGACLSAAWQTRQPVCWPVTVRSRCYGMAVGVSCAWSGCGKPMRGGGMRLTRPLCPRRSRSCRSATRQPLWVARPCHTSTCLVRAHSNQAHEGSKADTPLSRWPRTATRHAPTCCAATPASKARVIEP